MDGPIWTPLSALHCDHISKFIKVIRLQSILGVTARSGSCAQVFEYAKHANHRVANLALCADVPSTKYKTDRLVDKE